jgi:hypothetical protein
MPILTTAAVSPLYFIHRLGLRKVVALHQVQNPWDRDVKLKESLGVPQQVFESASVLLGQRLKTISSREGK